MLKFNKSLPKPFRKKRLAHRKVEVGTSSLLSPPEIKTSFSEDTDRSVKKDKKRFYKDEQKAVNFDLSLFWRLENFANLDGAYAVESDERFNSFAD